MEMPLVSVIIPAYNSEKFLGRCLDSILKQQYENIEVIIIDDGSIDNTWSIIEKYTSTDKRIRGIKKKNEGVSKARNIGIVEAKGDFIQFVDSDDFINQNMIYEMVNMINKEQEIDMVICGYNKIISNKVIEIKSEKDLILEKEELIKCYFDIIKKHNILYSPFQNLYRSNIIKENNLFFDENMSHGEDVIFNLNFINFVNKINITKQIFYNYDITSNNGNSLTSKFNFKMLNADILFMNYFLDFFNKNNLLTKENKEKIFFNYINGSIRKIVYLLESDILDKKELYLNFVDKIEYNNIEFIPKLPKIIGFIWGKLKKKKFQQIYILLSMALFLRSIKRKNPFKP